MSETLTKCVEDSMRNLHQMMEYAQWQVQQSRTASIGGEREAIIPGMHQLIRIFQVLNAERAPHLPRDSPVSARRAVIADGTSSGKTYTAVAIKTALDLQAKRKLKTLVVAPSCVINSAWTPDNVNHYCKSLNLPDAIATQDVRSIPNPQSLATAMEGDFILINYDKLGLHEDPADNRYVQFLLNNLPSIDMLIIDEAHNLKNVEAQRTQAFRQVIERTKDRPALLLTASPVPNKLQDIGFLLYMLDPEAYQRYGREKFDYRKDPNAIRNALFTYPFFYFSRRELQETFHLPPLLFEGTPHTIDLGGNVRVDTRITPVTLAGEGVDRYFTLWREVPSIGKIQEMRRILLAQTIEPILQDTLAIRAREDAQVSIFTALREGFITPLVERLAQEGIEAGVITGDVPVPRRVEIAQEFSEGRIPVLVSTIQTMGEGIPIHTRDKPCHLLIPEPPIEPGRYDQIVGRHYRLEQTAPVTVHEYVVGSEELNARMIAEKTVMEREGIRFRARWRPGTLSQDRLGNRVAKEQVYDRIVKRGLELQGIFDVLLSIEETPDEKGGEMGPEGYGSLQQPKNGKREKPTNLQFMTCVNQVRNSIGRPVEHLVRSSGMEALRAAYALDSWETSSSADTDRLIAQIIAALEENDREAITASGRQIYDRILDWGCGPACLERIIRRPVVNLDMDIGMIQEGISRTLCMRDEGAGRFVQANMRSAPLRSGAFDIVTTIYALQYNAQGYRARRDIEDIVKETNRVLALDGYALYGLPNQATTTEDFNALKDTVIPSYGFDVTFADFVKGYASDHGTTKAVFQGAYVIVAKKVRDVTPEDEPIPGGPEIRVYSPTKRVAAGGIVACMMGAIESDQKGAKEKVPATEFRTSDGIDLRDAIRGGLVVGGPTE